MMALPVINVRYFFPKPVKPPLGIDWCATTKISVYILISLRRVHIQGAKNAHR